MARSGPQKCPFSKGDSPPAAPPVPNPFPNHDFLLKDRILTIRAGDEKLEEQVVVGGPSFFFRIGERSRILSRLPGFIPQL